MNTYPYKMEDKDLIMLLSVLLHAPVLDKIYVDEIKHELRVRMKATVFVEAGEIGSMIIPKEKEDERA